MVRKIKPYKKKKGSEKQKKELNYYNAFADKIADHILANKKLLNKKKNKN